MQKSESTVELTKALIAFQSDVGAIPKTSTNPFFKSKYAGLPIVIETAGPYLKRHKLAVSQMIDTIDGKDALTTMLLHESGEWIAGTSLLHLVKDDPQSHGSSTTYGRRYGYMAILGLVADEDDDGNKGSGKAAAAKPPAPSEAPFSPLQQEIKTNPAYVALGSGKGQFLSDTVGFEVSSLKALSDPDCEQVLAALKEKS